MRVIQVVNVRWYNATAWYGVTLAKALQDAGHESLVLGLEGSPPLARAMALGLRTVALPLNSVARLPLLWRGMDKELKHFRPHVVNCHRGESFILWALLKKRHAFALVRTRGDQRPPRGGLINRRLHNDGADALVATNSEIAQRFQNTLGVPEKNIHIVPGGVDTSIFAPNDEARRRIRAQYQLKDHDVVFGLVGRMDEVKGIRETIMALGRSALLRGGGRLRLLLIGFSSQYDETDVTRWTAEAGLGALGEHVILTGKVERPQDYINALDIGLLASLGSEAIARAALEIMACRVPLLSSRVGVMPDLLPDACLFPAGDIAAMVDRMNRAAHDDAWRKALAEACLTRIVNPNALDVAFRAQQNQPLTLADFGRQTVELYNSALHNAAL